MSYPSFLFMTEDEIHRSLEKTSYRSGFPGMNGRSWSRLGNFYDLVALYSKMTKEEFQAELRKSTTEEEASICYGALSMKYGPGIWLRDPVYRALFQ